MKQAIGDDPESAAFVRDMGVAYEAVAQLSAQKIPLTWSDGRQIVADGAPVYAFSSTKEQFNDSTLFNAARTYGPGAVYEQWRQFGPTQTSQYSNELSNISTYDSGVADAAERLSALAGKGVLSVSAIDDAILSLTGLRSGKVVVDAVLEVLTKREAAKKAAADAAKATGTAGEVAGAGARNPLLDDAIPRDGGRLVVNQGPVPTCGHNSCGMVLNTLGKEVDIETLIQKLPPSERGIFAQDVASLMKSEGVPASTFGNRNVADLARYTSNGTPVVVRIVDKTGSSDFSHFVVVDGVTTRNGISVVAIRDPHGTQYFSPVTTFERNFSGDVVVPRSALE
ncbi:cysteine peptidase family C39 domain-containing protein [Pseudomonas sp. P2663]